MPSRWVAAFARKLLLGAKGMWLDETPAWLANQTLGEMMQSIVRIDPSTRRSTHLLLHGWVAFVGDTGLLCPPVSAPSARATIPVST